MADVAGIYIDTIVNFASSVSEPPKVAGSIISNAGTLVAVQGFLMQAWDSVTNQQYDWLVESPDFTGAYYPGPNSPLNIALAAVIIQC
jgi:hypothetical protein